MSEIFKIILSFFHNRNEGKMFVHPVTHDAHGLALKKKNPAKQDSPPAAGRASDILPFRRSAIRAERFLSYGNEVSYTIKKPCAGSAPKAQDLVFPFYWQALQLHQYEHIVDRANGVFEIPVAHADDDV